MDETTVKEVTMAMDRKARVDKEDVEQERLYSKQEVREVIITSQLAVKVAAKSNKDEVEDHHIGYISFGEEEEYS